MTSRWPRFVPAAVSAGYHAVIAVPMRLHSLPIGGLNLLYTDPLPPESTSDSGWRLKLARVLADLTVLAMVQDRSEQRADRLAEQTLGALNDRTHLSQAAGMVIGVTDLEPYQVRRAIRAFALRLRRPVAEVVREITDHRLDPALVAEAIEVTTLTDPDGRG